MLIRSAWQVPRWGPMKRRRGGLCYLVSSIYCESTTLEKKEKSSSSTGSPRGGRIERRQTEGVSVVHLGGSGQNNRNHTSEKQILRRDYRAMPMKATRGKTNRLRCDEKSSRIVLNCQELTSAALTSEASGKKVSEIHAKLQGRMNRFIAKARTEVETVALPCGKKRKPS